ncbi:MAG: transketolase [Thiotrichales bacterium]|nr:MAG: transketolase [Thiotrichales bacterium]
MSSRQRANAIRILSADAVQKAKSGHPGMPMGMADIAEVVWQNHLNHNPNNPNWFNRDRFIVSNGHGAMLLYSLLHLTGYAVSTHDLQQFRQLHSKTPGHPEHGLTPGVETTTGPLGQGLANAVGMAIAEKNLANTFNKENLEIVNHHTYVFMGDGCLMEGISHESASLAGTLGLGKLIAFWDDNGISIDGKVDEWFTDNTANRFKAYGWQVIENIDGHDAAQIQEAINLAKNHSSQPTLICCKTTIGFGAPNKAGTASAHGAPLGEEELAKVRQQLSWPHPAFVIPEDIKQSWNNQENGNNAENAWLGMLAKYKTLHPELAQEFLRRTQGALPQNFAGNMQKLINEMQSSKKDMATRKSSLGALQILVNDVPELLGGSADLSCSNLTRTQDSKAIGKHDVAGNYLHYGVREFAMCAIANGIALHKGYIPYVSTFLVFSDYARNAIRLAALMRQKCIYVFTHDSIGIGEDGPTHQPVEHISSLRLIPNLQVWRPCDGAEVAVAWKFALSNVHTPTILALSRQTLPHQNRDAKTLSLVEKGGYVLKQASGTPDIILVATGSEVSLATAAYDELTKQGHAVQVVSIPCVEVFTMQNDTYKNSVLPANVPTLVIEAGVGCIWAGLLQRKVSVISQDSFGESAPGNQLFTHFGFTKENVVNTAQAMLREKVTN